jgi:hypothetical protein
MTAAQSTSSSKRAAALDHTPRKSSRTEGKRVDYNESKLAAPECVPLSNSLMQYARVIVELCLIQCMERLSQFPEQAGCAGLTELRMRHTKSELHEKQHNSSWCRRNKNM